MNLSRDDADLFFKLMWELQFYLNQRAQIWPGIQSVEDYISLSMQKKAKVRDTLWKKPDWIEKFLDENPNHLSVSEKDIVRQWQRCISGAFYILRCLKTHAIFIGKESKIYGVLGLRDNLRDIFHGQPFPRKVEAVLLPYKGQIIYDGMMRTYDISFGQGIRSDLNEMYLTAKQNGRIITTLETGPGSGNIGERTLKSTQEWNATVEEIVSASGRMGKGTAIQNATFTLLRSSAKIAEAVMKQEHDLDGLWKLARHAQKALHHLQMVLNRAGR